MKILHLLTYSLIGVLSFLILNSGPNVSLPVLHYGLINENQNFLTEFNKKAVPKAKLAGSFKNKDSIIFVGDVLLARNVEFLMRKNVSSYPFEGVSFSNLSPNAFVVGNFEASIPSIHIPTEMLKMNFSVDKTHLKYAHDAGFTHFSLANNHSLDYGQLGLINTNEQLSLEGFKTFGEPSKFSTDSVEFVSLNDTKVALIGLHTLVQQPSASEIKSILAFAGRQSDFQIIYIHWGIEYDSKSSSAQRILAEQLVEVGADMIIGHHPHVVQEIELINGVPVFYSLGNYIFDQYFSKEVQQGLILHLEFGERQSVSLIPVTSEHSLSQPKIMSEKEMQSFLLELSRKSDPNLVGYIQAGVIPLNMLFATSSKMAIMNK